jgi:hypothetical protein
MAETPTTAMVRRASVTAVLLALVGILMVPTRAQAMEVKIVGNQLILSGPVVGDEPGKIRDALAGSLGIQTVILRNSPGGNAPAGYQVVSCFGSAVCARPFRATAIPRAPECFLVAANGTSPTIISRRGFHAVSTAGSETIWRV